MHLTTELQNTGSKTDRTAEEINNLTVTAGTAILYLQYNYDINKLREDLNKVNQVDLKDICKMLQQTTEETHYS